MGDCQTDGAKDALARGENPYGLIAPSREKQRDEERITELEREIALKDTDLGNSERDRTKLLRQITALQNKLTRALGDDARADHVRLVLGHYNRLLGRNCQYKPLNRNDELIRKAIRTEDTVEEGMRACFEAIDGLACRPFMVDGRRSERGSEQQRVDDLKYALGDEDRMNRCRRYAQEARERGNVISSWAPMVPKAHFDELLEEHVALRRTVELLRDMVALQDSYVVGLEERFGVREAVAA